MASDLEAIAARIRALAARADQHRADLPRIGAGLRSAAHAIAAVSHPGALGPGAPSPDHVIAQLLQVARTTPDAVAKLHTAASTLRTFADSLATGATTARSTDTRPSVAASSGFAAPAASESDVATGPEAVAAEPGRPGPSGTHVAEERPSEEERRENSDTDNAT